MTELSYTPASPGAGDALTFIVTGEAPSGSRVVVTADGDEKQASPAFGLEDMPEGTGSDRYSLTITGGTVGDFTLSIYEYGDTPVATGPIYYYNDAPTYAYPDSSDIVDALEGALPGLEATVERNGPALTIIFGGQYSGKDMQMTVNSTGIAGSESVVSADEATPGGPFKWGPVTLPADVYTADVLNSSNVSIITAPLTITIA